MAQRKDIPDILAQGRQQVSVLDDILTGGKPTRVAVASIRHDGATQMRAGLAPDTVEEYTQAMIDAGGFGTFPPMVVFHDGTDYWLGDGFHRLAAFKQAFPAYESLHILCDVRVGTRRDAVLFAASANATHGLRRTNADKRRAVETLLRDEEWAHWSDGEIARRCSVSQPFVSSIRRELASTQNRFESTTRKGADGRTIDTSKIGTNQPQRKTLDSSVPAANVVPSEATGSRQQGAALAHCIRCGRPLSDPASAIAGVGPCCAAKRTTAAGSGTAEDDEEQPLQVAAVADDDDQNWRIDDMIERLKSALGCLGDYEEVTGIHSHSAPLRNAIAPMLRVLESNRI